MSENLKEFLNYLSKSKDVEEKINALKNETDKEKFISKTIYIAKEHGFDLSADDFATQAHELDSEELASVAGGDSCVCFVGGGGSEDIVKGTQYFPNPRFPDSVTHEYNNPACGCVLYGQGNYGDGGIRCACACMGEGDTDVMHGWDYVPG